MFDWGVNNGSEYAVQRQDGRIIFGGMRWKSPTKEIGIEDDSTVEHLVGEGLKTFLRDAFSSLRDVVYRAWNACCHCRKEGDR